jgi:purine-binding chemotaxis protein CheW
MSTSKGLCTFWLAGMCFGVEVLEVQEVIRFHELTPVPLAPHVIEGLMNLRGQIITAIDLRRRMELPERVEGSEPVNLVIRTADGAVSLLVDQIGDVVEVDHERFEPPPETVEGVGRDLIVGAYKLDGVLLLELDTARVIAGLIPAGI